jgi:RNA polymerase sigma-54 factor
MALELRQQLKLTQQLIMTPQLQMAIKLLQLSRLELMDTIRHELEENPALEEVADGTGEEPLSESFEAAETPVNELPPAPAAATESKGREEFDWSGFLDDFSTPSRVPVETEDREAPKYEAFITRKESLNDHLLWQFLIT